MQCRRLTAEETETTDRQDGFRKVGGVRYPVQRAQKKKCLESPLKGAVD